MQSLLLDPLLWNAEELTERIPEYDLREQQHDDRVHNDRNRPPALAALLLEGVQRDFHDAPAG